ncbi:hypothetical protein LCGC14_2719960, partial [marine sediment metagenome]
NMTNSATLQAFVAYCRAKFPARRYVLFLNDHGDGIKGIMGGDERRPACQVPTHNRISIPEWAQALSSSTKKLDIVGCDACLMAMIEVATQLKGVANYYVASQLIETASWPYGTLIQRIHTNIDDHPSEIATGIVTDANGIAGIRTLSATVLNKRQNGKDISDLNIQVKNLSTVMRSDAFRFTRHVRYLRRHADRMSVVPYDPNKVMEADDEDPNNRNIDLGNFGRLLHARITAGFDKGSRLDDEALSVRNALQNTGANEVILGRKARNGYWGLCIFWPDAHLNREGGIFGPSQTPGFADQFAADLSAHNPTVEYTATALKFVEDTRWDCVAKMDLTPPALETNVPAQGADYGRFDLDEIRIDLTEQLETATVNSTSVSLSCVEFYGREGAPHHEYEYFLDSDWDGCVDGSGELWKRGRTAGLQSTALPTL